MDEAYGQTKRTDGARACRNASSPIIFRTCEQFAAMLTGLDLVEPGLVESGLVTLTGLAPGVRDDQPGRPRG